jgi:hypothetical protein
MRLLHSSGVANDSTVGLPDLSAWSNETSCSGQTGLRVQILAIAFGSVATGLGPTMALVPICAGTFSVTLTAPWPAARWLATSTRATPTQLPGDGRSTSAT